MEGLKNYTIELVCVIAGVILLIIGLVKETEIVLFNLDGFYFFIAGLLIGIYGIGTAITKVKEQKNKKNKEVDHVN
ncbi:hypothetical protein [Vagococcus carniphilus]|uniref:hypothetical protein n=1 Tax=Vagococcus carniphilus TaxID=218144 RepID=UPI003BA88ED3